MTAGPLEVSGHAHAGEDRTVARVDASRAVLDLVPGEHHPTARVCDSSGASRPGSTRRLWNPKGYSNSSAARVPVLASSP